jgi:foldase protein PrsA
MKGFLWHQILIYEGLGLMDHLRSRHTSILIFALLLSGLATGAVWAQAPTPPASTPTPAASPAPAISQPASPAVQAPVPDDKVVLKVGDKQFTKADIDRLIAHLDPRSQQAIATQGKKEIGDRYALVVALSDQAHLHHLDQTPEFTQRMALEKQQIEAQLAFEEINQQAKVTPEEVQQYFTAHAADYDQITVRQFVVRKKAAEPKPDPAHPAASTGQGLSPEEAKTRAEAIRKEVAAGTDIKKVIEDFKAPGDVIIEAEPRAIRRGGMRPEMEKVAFALKDGEVSEPMDLPQALIFFQVTKHNQTDIKDVTPEIEKKLQQQKVNATLDGVKKSANVWMDEQYFAAPSKPAAGPTLGGPISKIPPKP